MSTGTELKVARLRAGAKQYEVAQQLRVSPQFLSLVELERRSPPPGFEERYMAAVEDFRQRMEKAGLLRKHE